MRSFKNLFTIFSIVMITLYGCGGISKMTKNYGKVKIKATPEVLISKGGKVSVTINGTFPDKYFNKKAKIDFTPVLKYSGGEYKLKTLILKGESVEGDGTVIKSTGGSFIYTDVFDFKPDMLESKLVVVPVTKFKDKSVPLSEIKLAEGIINTEERFNNKGEVILTSVEDLKKPSFVTKSANIYFPYYKFDYNKNLPLNKSKQSVNNFNEIFNYISKGWKIESININSWASPEGEETLNKGLSDNRAKTATKFFKEQLDILAKNIEKDIKKLKKKDAKNAIKDNPILQQIKNIKITTKANGEDFQGFMAAIKNVNIKDKNAIINVIESQLSKTEREKKIKDMTVIYAEVENILEPLRRGEISVNFVEPKKSVEQIAMLSTSKPDSLKLEELLYAASINNDNNTKLKIYKSAISLYPDNWKAYNNAGYIQFKLGNIEDASNYFEKANTIAPNKGEILNNLCAIALARNNFVAAKGYCESAKSQGINTDYNLGIVLMTQGNYEAALKDFESKKCDYNFALAQLLLDNASGAKTSLECAEKNAELFYLMSVIGARTKNAQMMNDNLKKAIEADPKYRKQAKKDREFINFFNNADFMEITKF